MTAIVFAVGMFLIAGVVVGVGLCMAAKRGDEALGYEEPTRRCPAYSRVFERQCVRLEGHDGPHEMP